MKNKVQIGINVNHCYKLSQLIYIIETIVNNFRNTIVIFIMAIRTKAVFLLCLNRQNGFQK